MGSGSQKVYASVKSYGQRGKLLSRSDLQAFAESRDLDELVTRIKNTSYSDAVSKITKPLTAEKLESALRGHLADIHYSISKTAGDAVLDAYYLKFITQNLKLIIKGKILGKTQEELESKINLHAEELIRQRDIILKALVAKDLEETVASLSSTIFGEDAAKVVTLYNETQNLQVIDTYFDKVLIKQLSRAIKQSKDRNLLQMVTMDIDFYNLLSVLRGKFWGLDETQMQDLIVAYSPSAPRELLERMMNAASLKDALSELASTRYKNLIPQKDSDIDAISEFERAFEMLSYKNANSSFTKMFSPGTSVGITKLTAFEIRNIAAIAFAVEQKIPAETTMSKIIVEQE